VICNDKELTIENSILSSKNIAKKYVITKKIYRYINITHTRTCKHICIFLAWRTIEKSK